MINGLHDKIIVDLKSCKPRKLVQALGSQKWRKAREECLAKNNDRVVIIQCELFYFRRSRETNSTE